MHPVDTNRREWNCLPCGRLYQRESLHHDQPTGGLAFFECGIDDEKAAFLLFDTAKQWPAINGMCAMDGPINFGENDNF